MRIIRRGEAQGFLHMDLRSGRCKQVRAADHLAHTLPGIVDDHREVIGRQAIGTAHDDVPGFRVSIRVTKPLDGVLETDFPGCHAQPKGVTWAVFKTFSPAGPRICPA